MKKFLILAAAASLGLVAACGEKQAVEAEDAAADAAVAEGVAVDAALDANEAASDAAAAASDAAAAADALETEAAPEVEVAE